MAEDAGRQELRAVEGGRVSQVERAEERQGGRQRQVRVRQPAAEQVHAQGHHEQAAASELVSQLSEQQRADHLTDEVDRADRCCLGGGQVKGVALGENPDDRTGNGDLQPVEDPSHSEPDDHAGVEGRPV